MRGMHSRRMLAGLLLGAALAGCATNPVTGRSQLMLVSERQVIQQASLAYNTELEPWRRQGKLNSSPVLKARVDDITDRLVYQAIRYRPEAARWDWQVSIIDDPKTLNAFCLPGGRMALYTGLVERLRASDDEIAQVMGHEIAHALANHGAEKMSVGMASDILVRTAGAVAGQYGQVTQQAGGLAALLAWQLPNSRGAESEADRIGIELAARAGYHPNAAVSLWKKMQEANGKGPPAWLSTHPASEQRQSELAALVPAMLPVYEKARAAPVPRYNRLPANVREVAPATD